VTLERRCLKANGNLRPRAGAGMSSLPSFGLAGGIAPMSSSSSFDRQVSNWANGPQPHGPGLPIDQHQIGARGHVLCIPRNHPEVQPCVALVEARAHCGRAWGMPK
jgi:hypothetical protein